ncbi:hypothetical protein FCM35_KLT07350 [Carex littledalei]|uniref:Uncharacterized protein n=1 Tax=Carex littledalei TaxID=544730 RepID=A0A833QTJ1_9POAL|nr:hypothetical protein FCM35_KLT07350 [Carex littledalei]
MAEVDVPLLDKVYYDNCPGCVQELKNEHSRGIPYREFLYVWVITLCAGTYGSLFLSPFLG